MEFDEGASRASQPGHDQPTRERVARSILVNGPSTAAALAERRGLLAAWEEPPFREVETVSKLSDTTKELS